jgi:hypothetical protein
MIFTKEDVKSIVTEEYVSKTWATIRNYPRSRTLTEGQYEMAPYHRLIYHTLRYWGIPVGGYETALRTLEERVVNLKEDPEEVTADIFTKISEFFDLTFPLVGVPFSDLSEDIDS